jgi:hypothetical protein
MNKISLAAIAMVIAVAATPVFAGDNFPPNSFGEFFAQKVAIKK